MGKTEKKLGLLEVFCIASGAMISSGLFVLPAVIYHYVGPAIILSYLLAGMLMLPSLISQTELATAMPRTGGAYFFIGRSLGPLLGHFAGFANWFSISLKGAFALIGMGAFLQPFFPAITLMQIKFIALGSIFLFTAVNLISTKSSGHIQDLMVFALISILIVFSVVSQKSIEATRFIPFFPEDGLHPVIKVTGMVFISFGGLTKVASLAGEIKKPGKTLPQGMFLSYFVVMILYLVTIIVMVGVLDPEEISHSLTPLSTAANKTFGRIGLILLTSAALFSFGTTANASILSASRLPMAMAQDNLLPSFLARKTKKDIPAVSILFTALFMAVVIVALDVENLVKTASTMMLLLFFFVNLSVILMRESRIVSYKPLFKSPLYPAVQILGMLFSLVLIFEMGNLPLILSGGFFLFSVLWFLIYTRGKPKKDSALIRIVERVAARELQGGHLHEELTEILRDRDNINEDRFDTLIRKALILDIDRDITKEELFTKIANGFSLTLDVDSEIIKNKLEEREMESSTAISPELAIPHVVVESDTDFSILIVRVKKGVYFNASAEKVTMIFSLAGSSMERNFHLKSLMAIAQIVQTKDFSRHWEQARDTEELRSLILLSERSR